MPILRFYSTEGPDGGFRLKIFNQLKASFSQIKSVQLEYCYHVESNRKILINSKDDCILRWLFKHPQQVDTIQHLSSLPLLRLSGGNFYMIEIGPRFNFSTPFSTNCVNICQNIGLGYITRIEISIKYLIEVESMDYSESQLVEFLSDRMTECQYNTNNQPIESFNELLPKRTEPWYYVPVLEQGRLALENVNAKLGLAFSEWDLNYYLHLFQVILKRNPTNVELFDCAQSNSEHSRHWFFRGILIIDGDKKPKSLIRMIMDTQKYTNPNNTIKFSDNSSGIIGFQNKTMRPVIFDGPDLIALQSVNSDIVFTAETHNMPTAVSPFSGAATGTGGRIRDMQGVGRGGIPIAGTVGYCVGCLNIPGYPQFFETSDLKYPSTFAKPLKILIEASNGASDYGNKFGEPVISGFAISYGIINEQKERDEFVKPIMFSGGLGTMNASMRSKVKPTKGMLLAKIGGPVYRIGVGGGSASSVEIQGSNDSNLDFNAVQRGDAEMENKLNRVVKACIEMGERNPILAIHDQGAGGNGNVLKELVEPGFAGAIIFSKEFQLGDPTINILELWGAEYQENNAILCKVEDRQLLENICYRERCPINFVGVVTGDGLVTLVESEAKFEQALQLNKLTELGPIPFSLELDHVLGDIPKREYQLEHVTASHIPLNLEFDHDFKEILKRVLSILAVGSKRFLTNKVDRCVGGLVVQQQCVGPLHTPLADYGLTTISHFGNEGIATSIGTQPIKGLLSASSMARMSVAEALSNLVFVKISELADIKCSGNWMWAAKLPGEGAKLFDACSAMCEIMKELKIAVDGGKDSLSMAAKVDENIIKSPGTLVISAYAPCPDVNIRVTPDIKGPAIGEKTVLLWINIEGKFRLGASAFAQAIAQQGIECPTVLSSNTLATAFCITQQLLQEGKLLAGHDISDGGLLICLIEMAIGGLSGLEIDITNTLQNMYESNIDKSAIQVKKPELAILFAEECGWVEEVLIDNLSIVQAAYTKSNIPNYVIGIPKSYGLDSTISVISNKNVLLEKSVKDIFKQWEKTSYEIEKNQMNIDCANEEYNSLDYRTGPQYRCSVDFIPELNIESLNQTVRVAVLREEGVNSDREVIACLLKANFEVHDVTMSDLLSGKTTLDRYRGIIFPGGFSYADVLGSAKGWAANIIFNDILMPQFNNFKNRNDSFSLGICNGCQLMCLLGWIGDNCILHRENVKSNSTNLNNIPDVVLLHNNSERFECRWATVHIKPSNAIMLKGLANSVLGCWIAHGEGKFTFRTELVLKKLKEQSCVTLEYVDDAGMPTEKYPLNPNGSIDGIAGLCSIDGRHLAIMPHPERCSTMKQWPYISPGFKVKSQNSPWQMIFNNAYRWCTNQ